MTGEDHEMFKKWPQDKGGKECKGPHNDDHSNEQCSKKSDWQ